MNDDKLNINQATISDLATLPGIGEKLAAKIVEYREQQPFSEVAELAVIPGISEQTVGEIADLLTVGETGSVEDTNEPESTEAASQEQEPASEEESSPEVILPLEPEEEAIELEEGSPTTDAVSIEDETEDEEPESTEESSQEQEPASEEESGPEIIIPPESEEEGMELEEISSTTDAAFQEEETAAEGEPESTEAASQEEETAAEEEPWSTAETSQEEEAGAGEEPKTIMAAAAVASDEAEIEPAADQELESAIVLEPGGDETRLAEEPPAEISNQPDVVVQPVSNTGNILSALAGAFLGAVLVLIFLLLINRTLRFAGNTRADDLQQQLDEEIKALVQDQADLMGETNDLSIQQEEFEGRLATVTAAQRSLTELQTEMLFDVETLDEETQAMNKALNDLSADVAEMDERLSALAESAENFDLFLSGMRDLLFTLQGPPPTPTSTVTASVTPPSSEAVSPTPQSTPVSTSTPLSTRTPLPTRTPRPTATPLSLPSPTHEP